MLGMAAVPVNTHIACGDATYGTLLIVQDFGGGKARENIYPQAFCLFAQPAGDITQTDNIVAFILEAGGEHPVRCFAGTGFAKEKKLIFFDDGFQRRTFFFPVRDQLVKSQWVHDRARKNMGANFAAFFQYTDGNIFIVFAA